jgi:hypothetical protein
MWLSIIHKPFPLSSWRNFWKRSVGFGLFVFLFLFLFKPFDVTSFGEKLLFACIVFGLVTAAVLLVGGWLLINVIEPRIKEERWTLGKQILYMLLLVVFIALLNTLASQWMINMFMPFSAYLLMLKWVVMLGVFPVAFAELLAYNHYLRKHVNSATQLNLAITETHHSPDWGREDILRDDVVTTLQKTAPKEQYSTRLVLTGENQNERLDITPCNLLAIQSVDNYVTIYWEDSGVLKSQMLRNTLTNIHCQTSHLPWLFRSHRAWILNLQKIIHIDGNAQGYKVKLPLLETQVPVSRNNIAAFKELAEKRIEA